MEPVFRPYNSLDSTVDIGGGSGLLTVTYTTVKSNIGGYFPVKRRFTP